MKQILRKIPTEEEIDKTLDEGYEVEVYMRDGEVVMETCEAP